MDDTARALHQALVAVYRPYLAGVADAHDLGSAVDDGEAWLDRSLASLLSQPFVRQKRGPLEVFQEAMRFPTQALVGAGVPAPSREALELDALPGDIYGLAPVSSQDLGETVWTTHLAWGAAKARALTTVAWFGRDLSDRSKIESAAAGLGKRVVVIPESLLECGLVVIDLDYPQADDVIGTSTGGGWPTIVYGPHVGRDRLEAAERRGARALPRSRFFADLSSVLA